MNGLQAVAELLEFIYSALVSYARTPDGEAHLTKLENALGMNGTTTQPQQSVNVSGDVMPSYTASQSASQ